MADSVARTRWRDRPEVVAAVVAALCTSLLTGVITVWVTQEQVAATQDSVQEQIDASSDAASLAARRAAYQRYASAVAELSYAVSDVSKEADDIGAGTLRLQDSVFGEAGVGSTTNYLFAVTDLPTGVALASAESSALVVASEPVAECIEGLKYFYRMFLWELSVRATSGTFQWFASNEHPPEEEAALEGAFLSEWFQIRNDLTETLLATMAADLEPTRPMPDVPCSELPRGVAGSMSQCSEDCITVTLEDLRGS